MAQPGQGSRCSKPGPESPLDRDGPVLPRARSTHHQMVTNAVPAMNTPVQIGGTHVRRSPP